MSKYVSIYQKFLNLSQAVDEITDFPKLTPDEKCLIQSLNNNWVKDKLITVVEAMNAVENRSTSTVFRNLKKIREKGYIYLEVDETDSRIKYIKPSEQTLSYFHKQGELILKTAKSFT